MGIFEYIAVLTSIIIGLGMANLLRGLARLIQHPGKVQVYWVHLCWVGFFFFNLVFWWWWEFKLGGLEVWTFHAYFFVIFYAFILFMASAILFPDSMEGYASFKEYFYSRRTWFFSVFVITYLADLWDTLLKGQAYFMSLGNEYLVATGLQVVLGVVAMITRNERFHQVFAVVMLIYQISWALRMYETVA
jgi:hypothetical protein